MILDEGAIAERWSVLLHECSQEGPGILAAIEENLEEAVVPGLSWSQESVSTGVLKGLSGRRRDALVITYKPLREWQVLVFAHPFGTCLHVSWVFVVMTLLSRDFLRAARLDEDRVRRHEIGAELDAFSRMDLAAFLALTRHAVKSAIESVGSEEEFRADDQESEDRSWGRRP